MNTAKNLSFLKEKKAQRIWLLLVITWACIRAVAINGFFGKHGINGWSYFVVDLVSAIPYAIYSGRAVIDFLDKDWIGIRKNGALAILFFYIPDLYVLLFAKEVPISLLFGFLTSVVIFSAIAIFGLRRDVSKKEAK